MNDLISRQAAIDLIKNDAFWVQYAWGGRGHKPEMEMVDDLVESIIKQMKESVVSRLEQMPSAQPEQRWIPCSERLPEDEKEVLVTRHFLSDTQLKKNAITEAFYVEVASRIGDEWTSYSDEYKIKAYLHKVIAWMPLPEPYAERRGE